MLRPTLTACPCSPAPNNRGTKHKAQALAVVTGITY